MSSNEGASVVRSRTLPSRRGEISRAEAGGLSEGIHSSTKTGKENHHSNGQEKQKENRDQKFGEKGEKRVLKKQRRRSSAVNPGS